MGFSDMRTLLGVMDIITRFERSTVPWATNLRDVYAFGDGTELVHSSTWRAREIAHRWSHAVMSASASGVVWSAFGRESSQTFGMVRVVTQRLLQARFFRECCGEACFIGEQPLHGCLRWGRAVG